jgi:hypothetical protein
MLRLLPPPAAAAAQATRPPGRRGAAGDLRPAPVGNALSPLTTRMKQPSHGWSCTGDSLPGFQHSSISVNVALSVAMRLRAAAVVVGTGGGGARSSCGLLRRRRGRQPADHHALYFFPGSK